MIGLAENGGGSGKRKIAFLWGRIWMGETAISRRRKNRARWRKNQLPQKPSISDNMHQIRARAISRCSNKGEDEGENIPSMSVTGGGGGR